MTTNPKAWVLVPYEPTPEMIDAGRWSEYGEDSLRMHEVNDEAVRSVWAEMLNKSPGLKIAPLGDDQIAEISVSCALVTPCDIYFARAIERKCAETWSVNLEKE